MLTDKAIKAAAAKNKPYKIADGNGLFLHVSQKGHKTFRFKFRFDKKEQLLLLVSIQRYLWLMPGNGATMRAGCCAKAAIRVTRSIA